MERQDFSCLSALLRCKIFMPINRIGHIHYNTCGQEPSSCPQGGTKCRKCRLTADVALPHCRGNGERRLGEKKEEKHIARRLANRPALCPCAGIGTGPIPASRPLWQQGGRDGGWMEHEMKMENQDASLESEGRLTPPRPPHNGRRRSGSTPAARPCRRWRKGWLRRLPTPRRWGRRS